MSVTAYFDAIADDYERRCTTGALGALRRAERRAVMALLDPRPGDRVLDAGCGSGFDAVPLARAGCVVTGVDLSPRMVEAARRRGVEAHVADLTKLDLGRTFDKVLCCGPLEFCHDPERALRRIAEHVAASGRLVLLVPVRGLVGAAYAAYHRRHGIRVRLFRVPALRRVLEGHGLAVGDVRRPTPYTVVMQARAPSGP